MLKPQGNNTKLTPYKISEIQQLYFTGDDLQAISQKVSIKQDTINKAIKSGRIALLREPERIIAHTKSEKTAIDNGQVLGKACSNVFDRILSCKTGVPGKIGFTNQIDLGHAGVLMSLPALLSNGLSVAASD